MYGPCCKDEPDRLRIHSFASTHSGPKTTCRNSASSIAEPVRDGAALSRAQGAATDTCIEDPIPVLLR